MLPLLDEGDQEVLRGQLDQLSAQYSGHVCDCESYQVQRWLEQREAELSGLGLAAVQSALLQVCSEEGGGG